LGEVVAVMPAPVAQVSSKVADEASEQKGKDTNGAISLTDTRIALIFRFLAVWCGIGD
jgi:hypothetical protein